ncbi:PTS sugar transporter subunit IIB [Exiguobacterium sp. s22]|uniref:PTS sugar transporter subunit IIB n=1 Tax=Exiguobacterium sp. s22 TaxID=2751272 RepID=UPI001BE554BF
MHIPTILVACGSGIATSTIVAQRVERLLLEKRIRAQLVQCTIAEVASLQKNASLVISTTKLPTKYETLTVIATSYITGVNMEEVDEQIITALQQ